MPVRTFWSRLFARKSSTTSAHTRRFRPRPEYLEDRTLLSASLLFDPVAGVWSDQETTIDGSVSARGGSGGGAGGFIEVSSKGGLSYGGTADAGASAGVAGTLLLDPKNLVIDASAGVLPQFNLIDPHPTTGARFGDSVTVLSNGNLLVSNPGDNFGGTNAGAMYLFNGLTGALISSRSDQRVQPRRVSAHPPARLVRHDPLGRP
jgi:hypothetical protein